ncbi:hypothetical protein AVEN_190377-1 [Araneus ventricosus]|uniref:DUF4817 domain-containing protein n=1 Tax=Araneus ventricosus TaxID=182803 RepID=A0A4Y2JQ06_ARAVE|nr:hypothetical protein AVEN_190377-1 [Araneus ventricosus]
MSDLSTHHADVARKSATGKIVLLEPAELRCSCKRISAVRRGPMSPCALRKMIQEFETTGQLGSLPGRGRRQIPCSSVEAVASRTVNCQPPQPCSRQHF